ncbi:hypothetical protein F5B19DRAFT_485327 [Rostrohypoxylon terebratum]|nr:hypothetical protein F5B19DRAFT_485327 [Rostrohypoxylon terebratum]
MPVNRYESIPADVSPLSQPLKFEFSGRVAKNRFYKASMIEDLATWSPTNIRERGIPTEELIELYRRQVAIQRPLAVSILSSICRGFIGDGIITPECPPSGPRFEAFQELATGAKAHGSLILGQVNHPGRQLYAKFKKDTISASAIQIQTSNQRTDEYGGSIENRMRIVVEVAKEIKKRTESGFILGIKLNSVEFQEKGIRPAEAKVMCEKLQDLGFDFVELSGGNHEDMGYGSKKESTRKREAYFLEFVRDIVPHLSKTKNDILAGKVTGAIRPRDVLLNDVAGHLAAAGAQMRQIAKSQEPVDLSNPRAVESLLGDLKEHFEKVVADGDKLEYRGFPDLKAAETSAHPYGEPY